MIAAVFLLKLCAGITLMWWLMPRRDVTDGFFRIQMRVLLGLCVLTVLLTSSLPDPTTATTAEGQPANAATLLGMPARSVIRGLHITAAVVSYLGSVFWALGRRLPGNICIHTLNVCCVGALVAYSVTRTTDSTPWQCLFSDLTTAAVVGSVLTGMLLGHWYLTTPTMSINPLFWFTWVIGIAAGLRLAASAWTLVAHGPPDQPIWLSMRWAGGIFAPLITMFLTAKILKLRNTQSATGVLFAGLILVFMGEMTATLLEQETLLPF